MIPSRKPGEPVRLRQMRYRLRRFHGGVSRLGQALDYLSQALTHVAPGARQELEYVIWKTEAFILHLQACCGIMEGFLAYDAAFRARLAGDEEGMSQRFQACEAWFIRACALTEETARLVARHCADPTERHILFRYNVRQVLPLREFRTFIHNVVNFHQGLPYWEPVNWRVIAPPSTADSRERLIALATDSISVDFWHAWVIMDAQREPRGSARRTNGIAVHG